ncbi:hypothetical protein NEPAR04_1500 [Nematocida parisii]|nr:hypothetical protein NEPAR08_1684 [Nematocida parisii]KAI5129613.1 hypothetical protein NEPAR03_1743 [Nematocida parisii]KAI5142254.1 hypothetical protein NEPAR04_1500 [Nematocida parisii]
MKNYKISTRRILVSRYRETFQNRQYSTYTYLFPTLLLLVMCCVFAESDPDVPKDACSSKDTSELELAKNSVTINLYGPLNPILWNLNRKTPLITNMRMLLLFLEQNKDMHNLYISANSTVESMPTPPSTQKKSNYKNTFTCSYKNDSLLGWYVNELLKTWSLMFPSMKDTECIKSSDKNSFYSVLVKNSKEKNDYMFLASLLLLSEGLPIPLYIQKNPSDTVISLKSPKHSTDILKITLNTSQLNNQPHDVIKIVEFFIDNQKNKDNLHSLFLDPCLYKEYKTGRFMHTPHFLIHTYILEYVSPNDVSIFNNTVHTILALNKRNTPNCRYTRVYNRYFRNLTDKEKELPSSKPLNCNYSLLSIVYYIDSYFIVDGVKKLSTEKADALSKISTFIQKTKNTMPFFLLCRSIDSMVDNPFFKQRVPLIYNHDMLYSEDSIKNNLSSFFFSTLFTSPENILNQAYEILLYAMKENLPIESVSVRLVRFLLQYGLSSNMKKDHPVFSLLLLFEKIEAKQHASLEQPFSCCKIDKMTLEDICTVFEYLLKKNNPDLLCLFICHCAEHVAPSFSPIDILITGVKDENRIDFVKVLTKDGKTMEYIMRTIEGIENLTDDASQIEKVVQNLLMTIIGLSYTTGNAFDNIMQECFVLLETKYIKCGVDACKISDLSLLISIQKVLNQKESLFGSQENPACFNKLKGLLPAYKNTIENIILEKTQDEIISIITHVIWQVNENRAKGLIYDLIDFLKNLEDKPIDTICPKYIYKMLGPPDICNDLYDGSLKYLYLFSSADRLYNNIVAKIYKIIEYLPKKNDAKKGTSSCIRVNSLIDRASSICSLFNTTSQDFKVLKKEIMEIQNIGRLNNILDRAHALARISDEANTIVNDFFGFNIYAWSYISEFLLPKSVSFRRDKIHKILSGLKKGIKTLLEYNTNNYADLDDLMYAQKVIMIDSNIIKSSKTINVYANKLYFKWFNPIKQIKYTLDKEKESSNPSCLEN